jgi:hypothetical protein
MFKEYFKCLALLAHFPGNLSLYILSHTSVFTFMMMMMTTTTTTIIIIFGFNGTVLHFPFVMGMNAAECLARLWQLLKRKEKKKSLLSVYMKINNS